MNKESKEGIGELVKQLGRNIDEEKMGAVYVDEYNKLLPVMSSLKLLLEKTLYNDVKAPYLYQLDLYNTTIKQIANPLSQLRNFDYSRNSREHFDNHKKQFIEESRRIINNLSPVTEPVYEALRDDREDLDKSKEILAAMENILKQSERTLDSIREASGKVGVSKHAVEFENAAKEWKGNSNIWLAATALFFVLTIASPFLIYHFGQSWLGIKSDVSLTIFKVTAVAILLSLTFWVGRNYRSAMHQYSINRHRAISLTTFRTFVEADEDPQVRQAVLLEATHSIFGNTSTGFHESKSESFDPGTKIVEIMKNIKPGS